MTTRVAYESVVAYPEGTSTTARFAHTAVEVGYDGIVVRTADRLPERPSRAQIAEHHDVDVVDAIELAPATPDDASGRLPALREEYPVVIVRGGTRRLNRFVADQRHVDVLAGPVHREGPAPAVGTIKDAIDNGVHLELDFGPLAVPGGRRVRYLDHLLRLWRLIEHHEAPYVVTLRPTAHYAMRAPRDVAALGEVVGIGADAVDRGLEAWATIAERNRHRQDGSFIEPGVELPDDEADDR